MDKDTIRIKFSRHALIALNRAVAIQPDNITVTALVATEEPVKGGVVDIVLIEQGGGGVVFILRSSS